MNTFTQNLESFLKESMLGQSAIDMHAKTGKLEIKIRQKICGLICDFIEEYFENNAKSEDIRLVCAEIIEIFPSLRVQPSDIGGIVRTNICLISYIFSYLFSLVN